MAENEKLDLGYPRSGRWRKLRESIRMGSSASEVAEETVRCLAQTLKNLRRLFEEKNRVPLKQVLLAATGEDGDFDEIMRKARFGRDYLQLFQLQCDQGLDQHAVVENVLSLTVERFMGKIGQEIIGEERFPDARSFREFVLSVRDEMIDGMLALENQLVERPDGPIRMPGRTDIQEERHQFDLLNMSVGVQGGPHS